jgi:hypothetical protein
MKINFNDLKTQYNLFKKDFDDSISKVLENQNFIMGAEVTDLEKTLSQFTGSPIPFPVRMELMHFKSLSWQLTCNLAMK